jgi:Sec-independent protein translocase protein TatA
MLDNFGMGEFLMLAIFALLFFGPERLPQMGARLGRWLSQLTQASKVFMTQWTEEAAVIQDAVREVQGIRDEIRAAQAEISGSLDVARQDIVQTIDEARSTVRGATVTPEALLKAGEEANRAASASLPVDTSAPPRLATPEETERVTRAAAPVGNESEALSKTQLILNDLVAKRGLSSMPGDDGLEPASDDVSSAVSSSPEQTDQAAEPEQEVEPVRESAYDKTQRLLDELMGKTKPEAVAEAPVAESASAQDLPDAEPQAGGPSKADGDRAEPMQEAAPERDAAPKEAELPKNAQRVTSLQQGVSYNDFTRLSVEVTQLRRELKTLQKELQALRVQSLPATVPAPETAAFDDPQAATMEEAA